MRERWIKDIKIALAEIQNIQFCMTTNKKEFVAQIDELYCILFDDLLIESFLTDKSINLDERQVKSGSVFVDKMENFLNGDITNAMNISEEEVNKWVQIQKNAKLFSMQLDLRDL